MTSSAAAARRKGKSSPSRGHRRISLSRSSSSRPPSLRQSTPSPGLLPLSPCLHPSPLAPPPSLLGSLSPLAVPPSLLRSCRLRLPPPPPSSLSCPLLPLRQICPCIPSRPSSLPPLAPPPSNPGSRRLRLPPPPPSSLSRPPLPLRHFLRSPLFPLSPDLAVSASLLRLPPPCPAPYSP